MRPLLAAALLLTLTAATPDERALAPLAFEQVAPAGTKMPRFKVDAAWPTMPADLLLGQVSGVAVAPVTAPAAPAGPGVSSPKPPPPRRRVCPRGSRSFSASSRLRTRASRSSRPLLALPLASTATLTRQPMITIALARSAATICPTAASM